MSFMYGQDIPIIGPIEGLKAAAQKQQQPAPQVSPLGALAAKTGGPKTPGVSKVSISGPAEGSIVWNGDRSYWREKNSPNWRPASEYSYAPVVEKKTTKVVK
jgi:hypothetical protein